MRPTDTGTYSLSPGGAKLWTADVIAVSPLQGFVFVMHLHSPYGLCYAVLPFQGFKSREYPNGGGSSNEHASKSFKLLRPDGHLLLSKRRSFSNILNNKEKNSPSWIRGSTRMGEGVWPNTQAKTSNSSGLTATYVLDKTANNVNRIPRRGNII